MNQYKFLVAGCIVFFFFSIFFEKWKENINNGDSWGYYSYLPSAFICCIRKHSVLSYVKVAYLYVN
ncbi:MAG: hypothetical protein IPL63_18375 [Saprospiraceae bacterium]|nr:hypothetical protein [Saprospiraceae bacterium]MBK7524442.1 hypothetical protein [Saprospiraceae bacterium]MBK8549235.1 hypothetical protein [Saprospiraceae bacterium]MBK8820196.1 hypothetical protein [Saprospiraceae bacterium]MBK9043779.1 hypothetical protein [Saprospiraceae bacterium]